MESYNKIEAAPGMFVNGQLTLTENTADIGGLSIAFQAFQVWAYWAWFWVRKNARSPFQVAYKCGHGCGGFARYICGNLGITFQAFQLSAWLEFGYVSLVGHAR